jgi:hypothetical protein
MLGASSEKARDSVRDDTWWFLLCALDGSAFFFAELGESLALLREAY